MPSASVRIGRHCKRENRSALALSSVHLSFSTLRTSRPLRGVVILFTTASPSDTCGLKQHLQDACGAMVAFSEQVSAQMHGESHDPQTPRLRSDVMACPNPPTGPPFALASNSLSTVKLSGAAMWQMQRYTSLHALVDLQSIPN